jgi:hypothetical protein
VLYRPENLKTPKIVDVQELEYDFPRPPPVRRTVLHQP